MNDLKKQVLFELIATPYAVIPGTVGVAMMLLSSIIRPLAFFGFIGLTMAFVAFVVNLLLNSEKISNRALKKWEKHRRELKIAELNDLDDNLTEDGDPRTQTALRDLRAIYYDFIDDIAQRKIKTTAASSRVLQSVDKIFDACVRALNHSYDLWYNSKKMSGHMRDKVLESREEIIKEVIANVSRLYDAVSQIRVMGLDLDKDDMSKLQARLQYDLEVAEKVDKISKASFLDSVEERYNEYL